MGLSKYVVNSFYLPPSEVFFFCFSRFTSICSCCQCARVVVSALLCLHKIRKNIIQIPISFSFCRTIFIKKKVVERESVGKRWRFSYSSLFHSIKIRTTMAVAGGCFHNANSAFSFLVLIPIFFCFVRRLAGIPLAI